MAIEIPTRLVASARRELIEAKAAQLFAERGYASTTVDDIVRAAGVTKPMLYRHFDSKKHLYIALLEHYRDELAAAPLSRLVEGAGDPRSRVPAMIDAWLAHIEQNPHAARLLFQPDMTGDPEVRAVQRELHGRQRAADVALLHEFAPGLPKAEIEPLGEAIRSCLAGLALWWVDHPDVPRAVMLAVMMRVVDGVLGRVG